MSRLILIPTPIGNLDDITMRALNVLKTVDILFAEDTRHTGQLLKHFDIQCRMQAYHMHNEHQRIQGFVRMILECNTAGLVTDAGTPGISDPGFLLVRECLKAGIDVECLPGPTAFVPALVMSGLASDRFCFEGFLPQKKGRKTRLELLSQEERTMIFYESPFRVGKTIREFITYFGADRKCSVSREISKMFEETVRGNLKEVALRFSGEKEKGEFVIVIEGKQGTKA